MIMIVLVEIDAEGKNGIENLISSQEDLMIQGIAKDNYDAIMLVKKFHPNIVLLDAALGFSGGTEISHTLRRYSPSTEIVVFCSQVEDFIIQGMAAGKVFNCLLINADLNRLAAILRGICQGDNYINSQVIARAFKLLGDVFHGKVLEDPQQEEKPAPSPADFSRAEIKILRLVAEGYSGKEIAKLMGLKDGTVRNYISSLMQKAGLKTRSQIVIYALENGLGKVGARSHTFDINELARQEIRT